jgi:hypothetical protein
MKALVKIFVAPVLALLPNIALAEQTLLLNLKYKSDNTVTKEIRVYGNDIDPNSNSIDDQFSLSINGQIIKIPSSIYTRLEWLRRSFSYDYLSGGIEQKTVSPTCLLGGPARGIVLKARYLTYQNDKIGSSQMRPVFSLPSNCLFAESYSPKNSSAREDARGVVEILNTLNLFLAKEQD